MKEASNNNEFGADLIQIIEENLDLRHWKFHLSYTKLGDIKGYIFRRIIYDSEWCRIQFEYYRRVPPDDHELHIYYGRLHALNEDYLMIWNGEKCRCWHSNSFIHLYFLDGLSPIEALQHRYSSEYPVGLKELLNSEPKTDLLQVPEKIIPIIRESKIWSHYGIHLFELFDLRRPDLWNKYTKFLKEYYKAEDEYTKLKGNTPMSFDPPRDKVC